MIRVGIIADTHSRGRALADLLADEERIEVMNLSAFPNSGRDDQLAHIDVVLATSLALVRSIPADGPPVLILGDERDNNHTLRDPVRGWLAGNPTAPELSAAIAAVAQNLIVLTESEAKRRFSAPGQNEDEERVGESLTPRELEVLRMLADGLGNKEIAKQLRISDHTAKFHVAQILAKLGAGSRAEAVALGMRRGLVPI